MKIQYQVLLFLLLSGCASAPPLSNRGAQVRGLLPGQVAACKYLQTVQYNDRIMGLGKDGTLMKSIGDTNLRNEVAAVGGNEYVVLKNDSNWFLGTVAYQADAYICPQ